MDAAAAAARMGGVVRTRELRAAGFSSKVIESTVRTGGLVRLRVGWLGIPSLHPQVSAAHAAGGRPACATVASMAGLWMLHEPTLHVEVPKTCGRDLRPHDPAIRVHWTGTPELHPRHGQPLPEALLAMASCISELDAVCAIDSALNRKLIHASALRELGAAHLLNQCDDTAESGVESVFRVRARAEGYVFRTQVEVPGSRFDFVFGDRLAVEVDGSEHHSGHEAFIRDRERDAWHAALGFRVVRLTYDQVIRRWHEVSSLLRILHSRNEHLRRAG